MTQAAESTADFLTANCFSVSFELGALAIEILHDFKMSKKMVLSKSLEILMA